MSINKLCDDILLLIFEEVYEQTIAIRPQRAIVPLQSVCKTWQIISSPLLYRKLHIDSPTTARLLAEGLAMTRSHHPQIPSPLEWTREVACMGDFSDDNCIWSRLLSQIPRLRRLVKSTWLLPTDIFILNELHTSTLTCLRLSSFFRTTPELLQFLPLRETMEVLTRFPFLETLSLGMSKLPPYVFASYDGGMPILEFKSLKELTVGFKCPAALEFLAWCRFPSLKRLRLDSIYGAGCYSTFPGIGFYLPISFWEFHSNIETLDVDIWDEWVESLLHHANLSATEISWIPLTVLTSISMLIPPPTKQLRIIIDEDKPESWRNLAALERSKSELSLELSEVHLCKRQPGGFSWTCGAEDRTLATMVSSILPYATALEAGGIRVFDSWNNPIPLLV